MSILYNNNNNKNQTIPTRNELILDKNTFWSCLVHFISETVREKGNPSTYCRKYWTNSMKRTTSHLDANKYSMPSKYVKFWNSGPFLKLNGQFLHWLLSNSLRWIFLPKKCIKIGCKIKKLKFWKLALFGPFC